MEKVTGKGSNALGTYSDEPGLERGVAFEGSFTGQINAAVPH
jgi:hypothetical protein